jgi:MFS transporter, SET family, sugar efflux transporter
MLNIGIWRRIIATPHGLTLSLCIGTLGLLLASVSPLLPVAISEGAKLDKGGVTLFYLINSVTAIVIILSSGYLSDGTIKRYKLVAVAGILASFGYAGVALARTPFQAYLAGIVMTFISILFPQLFAISREGILRSWDTQSQTVGVTCLRTMFSFGFIFGTTIASFLTRFLAVNTIFFLLSASALILTGFSTYIIRQASLVKETNEPETSSLDVTADTKQIKASFLSRVNLLNARKEKTSRIPKPVAVTDKVPFNWITFGLLVLAIIFMRGSDAARSVYLPLVMKNMFNDVGIAPIMLGITAAAELITMSLVGMLALRIGERSTLIFGALAGSLYFVLMAVSQALPTLYAVQLIYSIYVAALLGVGMAYVQSLIAHRAGLGSSVYMSSLQIGSMVGLIAPLLITGVTQQIFYAPAVLCLIGSAILVMTYAFEYTTRVRAVRLSEQ